MRVTPYANMDEAIKANEFFAVNVSDRKATQPRGQLTFRVPTSDPDNPIDVMLPATWLPIDLKTYASPEDLARSNELRALHRNNLLIFVNREVVEKMQTSQRYEAERQRVEAFSKARSKDPESSTYDLAELMPDDVTPDKQESVAENNTPPATTDPVRQAVQAGLRTALSKGYSSSKDDIANLLSNLHVLPADIDVVLASHEDKSNPIYSAFVEARDIVSDKGFKWTSLSIFQEL